MSNQRIYNTVKLQWDRVAVCMEDILSKVLATNIRCEAHFQDSEYWGIAATNHDFTIPEIRKLLLTVQAPDSWYESNIPTDSDTSKYLDVDLCRALLQEVLKTSWIEELVKEDALWMIGVDNKKFTLPEKCKEIYYINGSPVVMEELMDKETFTRKLIESGGNFGSLQELGAENNQAFRDSLIWHYPLYGTGYHGCYLALVKEGVLMLPYNTVTDEDKEIFDERLVRLVRSQDIRMMITDLKRFNQGMTETLKYLHIFTSYKEGKKHEK